MEMNRRLQLLFDGNRINYIEDGKIRLQPMFGPKPNLCRNLKVHLSLHNKTDGNVKDDMTDGKMNHPGLSAIMVNADGATVAGKVDLLRAFCRRLRLQLRKWT